MDSYNEDTQEQQVPLEELDTLTEWDNEPTLMDLQQDFNDAKPAKDQHVSNINYWLDHLNVEGTAKPEAKPNRSAVQPKLIRKNNEWRYPSLTEPFLSTPEVFNISPNTFEDTEAARQNQLLLNYQFNHRIDKVGFFDELVRTGVDEGTAFVRVGWDFQEREVTTEVPTFGYKAAETVEEMELLQLAAQGLIPERTEDNSSGYPDLRALPPTEWETAVQLSQQRGAPIVPYIKDIQEVNKTITIKNQPTLDVVPYENLTIDPSCNGDLSKAKFAVYAFETSLSELEAAGIYENLDDIMIETNSILAEADFDSNDDTSFNFKDEPRKKFVAYEYWGYWDIHNTGLVEPIVATWVGNTLIRMEENPYPDKEIPFVSYQYLPVRKSLYGEPDGELLIDNQKIYGAVTRGMIDIMARSANAQTGVRKDLLDIVNRRKYQNGEDYEFNPTVDPRAGIFMHEFNEIPNSATLMLQSQQNEANEMTGVRPYGTTDTTTSNSTSGSPRGVLDAASKRETAILRRLSNCIKRIGHKIISMNQEFLEDQEIIRVTNEEFIAIDREALAGGFDLILSISTVEEDNAKAQELSFMLQTVGPNTDPKMTYKIMANIADLRHMPDLAEELRNYDPQPSEMELAIQQEELRKVQLENAKIEAEIAKIYSDGNLSTQKAGTEVIKQSNIQSDTDLKNLDFVEQESGVKQERDLQQDSAQARANLTRDLINNAMKASQGNSTST